MDFTTWFAIGSGVFGSALWMWLNLGMDVGYGKTEKLTEAKAELDKLSKQWHDGKIAFEVYRDACAAAGTVPVRPPEKTIDEKLVDTLVRAQKTILDSYALVNPSYLEILASQERAGKEEKKGTGKPNPKKVEDRREAMGIPKKVETQDVYVVKIKVGSTTYEAVSNLPQDCLDQLQRMLKNAGTKPAKEAASKAHTATLKARIESLEDEILGLDDKLYRMNSENAKLHLRLCDTAIESWGEKDPVRWIDNDPVTEYLKAEQRHMARVRSTR